MKEMMKKALLYILEVIAGAAVWCILDYIFTDSVDVLENLICVAVIVLMSKLFTAGVNKKEK